MLLLLFLLFLLNDAVAASITGGLQNVGQTCYANTALQSLATITEAVQIILAIDREEVRKAQGEDTAKTLLKLQTILYAMRARKEQAIPRDYLEKFWPELASVSKWEKDVFSQQDIDDFHASLFHAVTQSFLAHDVDELAHLKSIYMFRQALQDRENGTTEEISETPWDIWHLFYDDGKTTSLEQLMREKKQFNPASQGLEQRTFCACAAPVIFMHFYRFDGTTGIKYEKDFEVPVEFDLASYMEVSKPIDGAPVDTRCLRKQAEKDSFVYSLRFTAIHSGSTAHSGHYYGYRRQASKWFELNDSTVKETSKTSAVDAHFGGTAVPLMLVYVRKDAEKSVLDASIGVPSTSLLEIEAEMSKMFGGSKHSSSSTGSTGTSSSSGSTSSGTGSSCSSKPSTPSTSMPSTSAQTSPDNPPTETVAEPHRTPHRTIPDSPSKVTLLKTQRGVFTWTADVCKNNRLATIGVLVIGLVLVAGGIFVVVSLYTGKAGKRRQTALLASDSKRAR